MAQTRITAFAVIVFFCSGPHWSVSSDLHIHSSSGKVQLTNNHHDEEVQLYVPCATLTSLKCELVPMPTEDKLQVLRLVWTKDDGTLIRTGGPMQLRLPLLVRVKSDISKFVCRSEINGKVKDWKRITVQVTRTFSSSSPCHQQCGHQMSIQQYPCCVNCSTDGSDEERSGGVLGLWSSWSRCFWHVQSRRRSCNAHHSDCRMLPHVEKRYCREAHARKNRTRKPLQSAVNVHEVVKRSSGICDFHGAAFPWSKWSSWSPCDSNGKQTRNRYCCLQQDICMASGAPQSLTQVCGTPETKPTSGMQTTLNTVLVLTTAIHHQTKPRTKSVATSLPSKQMSGHLVTIKPATKPTTLMRTHATLMRTHATRMRTHATRMRSHTTRHAMTRSSHRFASTSPHRPSSIKHVTATSTPPDVPKKQTTDNPGRGAVKSTHRTDSYNLRVTVAVSSGLVGSLLLVAVVACWRRLHLEQLEQQRQLLQPEATQPEYHGLQHRNLFQQAPPPTYHDAFQLDAIRAQETQQNASGSSSSSQQPTNSLSAATSPSSSSPRASEQMSSSSNQTTGENSGHTFSAISHKVRTNYMLSRLKAGMTEDEMPLDDDDVLSQSDILPLL